MSEPQLQSAFFCGNLSLQPIGLCKDCYKYCCIEKWGLGSFCKAKFWDFIVIFFILFLYCYSVVVSRSCSSLSCLVEKYEVQAVLSSMETWFCVAKYSWSISIMKKFGCEHLGSRCLPLCRLQLHYFPLWGWNKGQQLQLRFIKLVQKGPGQWKKSKGEKPITYRRP